MPPYDIVSVAKAILKQRIHNFIFLSSTRCSHTDIKVPNFDYYRRNSVKDPNSKTSASDDDRRCFTAWVSASFWGIMLYSLKAEIYREVMIMAPSADVLALAQIEINLDDIPEGTGMTFKWRGKPLFVRHRTPQEIKVARAVPMSALRDPELDEDRVKNPDFLVILGICTHLGCVPITDSGDFGPGGYYCPCHGSHFDASGRARKGPAPTNMEVPEYVIEENKLIVG